MPEWFNWLNILAMFEQHYLEWTLLIAGLLGLVYLMIIIKEEKNAYNDSAIATTLHQFKFDFPSWWTETSKTKNSDELNFERTDTRYEWKAFFKWYEKYDERQSIQEQLVEIIKSKNITLDEQEAIIHSPLKFNEHPEVKKNNVQVLRVEGTGTENEIDRIYFDAYVIRDLKNKNFLYCESKSSVLNGLIEGPYFEESINNFKMNH